MDSLLNRYGRDYLTARTRILRNRFYRDWLFYPVYSSLPKIWDTLFKGLQYTHFPNIILEELE